MLYSLMILAGLTVGFLGSRIPGLLRARKPWINELQGWKLSQQVRREPAPYWPKPPLTPYGWKRKSGSSYCLRCGASPFVGQRVVYSKGHALMPLCWPCWRDTTYAERTHFLKLVVDVWICHNFDARFNNGPLSPMSTYFDIWTGVAEWLRQDEEQIGSYRNA